MSAVKLFGQALRGLFSARAALATTLAGTLAIATPVAIKWEDIKTVPYADKLADGLMTVCAGETRVKMREYTHEECVAMLEAALIENIEIIDRAVSVPLNDHQRAAFAVFIHNVGPNAFRKSTLLKKLNAGDYRGACDELLRWNRAGGRVVKGLSNRREHERQLCMTGVQ